MGDGRDIFEYVFERLREFEAYAVPSIALGANPDTIKAVRAIGRIES